MTYTIALPSIYRGLNRPLCGLFIGDGDPVVFLVVGKQ